jgi:hypothetical protein
MKWLRLFRKPSKQLDFLSDFKRQARNRRYYLRHRDELRQKRKDYYSIWGK